MKKLSRDSVIYKFSKNNEPVIKIDPGERILVETDDCFRSQLRTEEDSLDELNWDHINPATGPIYVNGAKAGDILKIKIENIDIDEQSVIIVAPDEGVVGDRIKETEVKILPVEDNNVVFADDIEIPIKPMIGVIGTAPVEGEIPAGTPDKHGGNMDCKRMVEGNTLYLPVNVEGALLALGDMHSVMGDGEIAVAGAETRREAELQIELIKNEKYPLPMLESDEKIITIASAKTLDQAVKDVTDNMVDYLRRYYNFSLSEATMLLSLAGDARICQVVDPLKTARFELEKSYIKDRGGKTNEN